VWVGEWDNNYSGDDRGRYFDHAPIDVEGMTLTIHGVQYARGTTGRSIKIRLDEELQTGGDDLTVQDARRVAAMLLNLADTCEILDGVER
jgi:hypothetical protein